MLDRIEDTREPTNGQSCPMCDGDLTDTWTGVRCLDPFCGWAWDNGNYDAEDEE
jgi:hypothetical protein